MHLYSKVEHKRQSFKGSKVFTVPSQSMSLKEIISRFIRRESLPISREGVYNERMGDLEKLANEDISVQMERVAELKENIAKGTKRVKDAHEAKLKAEIERQAAEKAAAEAAENSTT